LFQPKLVTTEWSKKIMSGAKTFGVDVFELITLQGDKSLQL